MRTRHSGRSVALHTTLLATLLAATVALGACLGPRAGSAPGAARPSAGDRARSATSDDWEGTATARAEELFVGRFPGVRVVAAPGGLSIRIRGQSTINGDGAPLYVVDGMPMEPTNGLLSLNPGDIGKIEILKDIGQTAFYGVRGANGVVLISTKKR